MRCGELRGDAVTVSGSVRPALGQVGEARRQVLPLPIQCLIGGLEGGVRGDDVLQLLDPSSVLVGDVALLGDLTFEGGRTAPVPADLVFGLLE